jgi:hypothetical protein
MPKPNYKSKIGMHTLELTNLLAKKEVADHHRITNEQIDFIKNFKNKKQKIYTIL